MNKNITKRDIIEGIGFVLMVVGIITLLCALYQLNEVNTIVKELRVTTNRK